MQKLAFVLSAVLVAALASFVYADSCFNACCSSGEWVNYSYGNFTKRGSTTSTSDCACLTDVVFPCNKTEPAANHALAPRSIKDHCFDTCCSRPDVVAYSYGDAAVFLNSFGVMCTCGNQAYFECKSPL